MTIKRLAIGGLVASTLPFFVSQSYTLYFLAMHHTDEGMTEAKAIHQLHHHFPGKQLLWVCDVVAAFWVLPVVFLSSFVKPRPKKLRTRVIYTEQYNALDPAQKTQLEQAIAHLPVAKRRDSGDFSAQAAWERWVHTYELGQ